MARKRSFGIAIVLFAGVLFQEAYAVPSLTISMLRASACCARNCGHCRTLNGAASCCHLSQAAQDPATISAAKRLLPNVSVAVLLPIRSFASTPTPAAAIVPVREVFARPAPIFLLDRSLRL